MHERLTADGRYDLVVSCWNGCASRHVCQKTFFTFEPDFDLIEKNQQSCKKIWNVYLYFGKYVDSQPSACTNCVAQCLPADPLQLGFGGRCSTLFRETLDPKIYGNQISIAQTIKMYFFI